LTQDICRILLVEDEPMLRRAIGRVLSDATCVIEYAERAEPALELLAERRFDILVTDLHMPGMSGLDLLRRAREITPETRRVLLSGHYDLSTAIDAINQAAVDRLMVKPLGPAELRSCIREVTQAAQREGEERRLATSYMLDSLVCALDLRDSETQWHSRRVAAYARHLGATLGLRGAALLDLERGALLHDIGKIGVSDSILHKPGKLDEAEWAEMRRHPALGYEMLRQIDALSGARLIVLQHQERWDGTGYPSRLGGAGICIGARIFHIIDAFDAITNDRPYRGAQSYAVARAEIARCTGTQFDPELVRAWDSIDAGVWRQLDEEACRERQVVL
jgi:response regulator RpfG family c-di-GMP phosphodiesterase